MVGRPTENQQRRDSFKPLYCPEVAFKNLEQCYRQEEKDKEAGDLNTHKHA